MASKLMKGVNDLATVNPELSNEWNYEKNYPLTPCDVLPGSNKKVWWKHEVEGNIFEWQATVNGRNSGAGNPYLSNQKVLVGYNDLATTNPQLAEEWDYEMNFPLTPEMVTGKSCKRVWWIQKVDNHIFKWQSTVSNRSNGNGNPFLAGVKVLKGYNDLATINPKLATEWDYEKNFPLTPQDVTANSSKIVWWKQEIEGHLFGWSASISSRNKGGGNPYLVGKRVKKGFNDLTTINPKLAAEWDYEKNYPLTPQDVTVNSNKKVWWKQETGGHTFSWKAGINNRNSGIGNPYLSNKKILVGFNDLTTTDPELAEEWDYERNGDLLPEMVSSHSPKRVYWIGKCGHSWKALIYNRSNGYGCPICAKEQQSSFPEQAIYFYMKKAYKGAINRDKEALEGKELDIYIPSIKVGIEYDGPLHKETIKRDRKKNQLCKEKDVMLIRVRDFHLNEIEQCICILREDDNERSLISAIKEICNILGIVIDIDLERDRTAILNQYVSLKKEHSLASEFPKLAEEWNYEKNHNIMPDMVLCGSSKKVWWKQEIDGIKFEWSDSVAHRVAGRGNPYISNKKLLKGYNDMATTFPELAQEWNYEKNGELRPDMIMAGSGKRVWWRKEIDGQIFEWEDSPNGRTRLDGTLSYPDCIPRQLIKERILSEKAPHLIEEWNYERNGELEPSTLQSGSRKKVWWKKEINGYVYEWRDNIDNRVRGAGVKDVNASEVIINGHTTSIVHKMNCGMNATIIEDNGWDDITIQFEDGTIVCHCQRSTFYRGGIKNPNYDPKSLLGQTRRMNCGMKCTVIEEKGSNDITVCFEDGTIVEHRRRSSFKSGMIANPKLGLQASKRKEKSILGNQKRMNCGMMCEVIEDNGAMDITVRFEDGTIRKNMRRDYFKRGTIANPTIKNKI